MRARIVTLPGDGIGPEVVAAAQAVLEAVARRGGHEFIFETHLIGGCSIDEHRVPLTQETLAACRASDAVLLGAVGGPRWDDPTAAVRPEQGLLALRQALGLFANLRPVRLFPSLVGVSPLKPDRLVGVDILIVRELTGGIYFGEPRLREVDGQGRIRAVDSMVYWDYEITRVVDLAFRLASERYQRVTSIDKANVLETSRLWRQVATEVAEKYPEVAFEHQLVDSAAMRLVAQPASFDVIVTGNLFGDILADEAAVLSGSLGNLPSASLGDSKPGLYEPVHGSAPDIAGKGIANPVGAILSAALLLRHSLGLEEEACAIEDAVQRAFEAGCRPADLDPVDPLLTPQMTEAIITRL